jgi:ribosome-associated protein
MPEDLRISETLVIPARCLSERFSRSSGPGGQGVNTTDSRVELSCDVAGCSAVPTWLRQRMCERLAVRLADGVLTVAASEHRAQLANRQAARERLTALLAEAAAPPSPPRRPTRPSRGARRRRLADKRRRGEVKRDRKPPEDEG